MKKATIHVLAAVLPALALVFAVTGCGTVAKEKKSKALDTALTQYGAAIRWGYYENALGYVHPDKLKELPEGLDNVRVTGYDVVQPPTMSDTDTVTQVARIEYLHRDVQRVRNLTDRQVWRYDAEAGAWWLHSGMPNFQ